MTSRTNEQANAGAVDKASVPPVFVDADGDDRLTVNQAAALLGHVDTARVRYDIKLERLPVDKSGPMHRVRRADVLALAARPVVLLSNARAADYLGITEERLVLLADAGRIAFAQRADGRGIRRVFEKSELDAFIARETDPDTFMNLDEAKVALNLLSTDAVLHLMRTRCWAFSNQGRTLRVARSDVEAFIEDGSNPLMGRLSMLQAAKHLGHCVVTQVSRWIHREQLPAINDHNRWWILPADLKRFEKKRLKAA